MVIENSNFLVASADDGEIGEFTISNPNIINEKTDVQSSLNSASNYLIPIIISLAVLAIIIAGLIWAAAAGDEEKISTAKKVIKFAIIGLVIGLMSVTIVSYIIDLLT